MPKYKVHVCRIGYSHQEIEVEAPSEKQAREKALEDAGNYSYSEHNADYEIEGVLPL